MKTKKVQAVVTMQVPKNVTDRELIAYLYDAIGTMKGCYHPESPICDFDGDKMHVMMLRQIDFKD